MEGKDKIKAAALELFVERGLSASTSLITKRAGVATGLLHHHFGSKDQLILELYSDCFTDAARCTSHLFEDASEDLSFDEYFALSEKSFWADVRWGVSNWAKFQYIALIDGSLFSDQYNLDEMAVVCEMVDTFRAFHEVGVSQGYIANLPADYAISISRSVIRSATELFHDNPHLLEDGELKREIRLRHWLSTGGCSPKA